MTQSRALSWPLLLVTAFSVSIGWGVRGQFGHEYGAALAGALAGMTIALLSGRQDWLARIHYFAFFGAVGFGFGGAMSYMKDIAFVHSSDSATVLYGFGCVFLLGGLWAAPCATGLGLAAGLDRERLTRLFLPLTGIFLAWHFLEFHGVYRSMPFLRVLGDTAWPGILALAVVGITVLISRANWSDGALLIVCMVLGSWIAHLILIELLHLELNPPRGDTWAGNAGMVAGILAFCAIRRWGALAFATLGGFFLGGIGFAAGAATKLVVMASGYNTNWHSVMEQSQGFFLGLALAVTMGLLAPRMLKTVDQPAVRRWTEVFAVTFVLWLLPYLNLRLSPGEWTKEITGLTPTLYGIPVSGDFVFSQGFLGWFDMVFLAIAIAVIFLLILHLRRPLPLIPTNWMGKGQLFCLVFLWTVVSINFMDVLPRFTATRLVTEWFMTVEAAACTILLMVGCFLREGRTAPGLADGRYNLSIRNLVLVGAAGAVLICISGWAIKRGLYGDRTAGGIPDQIRFGPHNTNTLR